MSPENPGSTLGGAAAVPPVLRRAVSAGLAGSLVGAAVVWALAPRALGSTVPAAVGLDGAVAGWLIVAVLGTAAGVGFAALASHPALAIYRQSLRGLAGLGVVYATALWLFGPAVALPAWLSVLGVGGQSAPWLDPTVLVGHVCYGVVLGVGYWSLR